MQESVNLLNYQQSKSNSKGISSGDRWNYAGAQIPHAQVLRVRSDMTYTIEMQADTNQYKT